VDVQNFLKKKSGCPKITETGGSVIIKRKYKDKYEYVRFIYKYYRLSEFLQVWFKLNSTLQTKVDFSIGFVCP
jgi:hypothetical protein